MQVDVYDTYANSKKGHVIHFDVLVPKGTHQDTAYKYALEWLKEIGEDATKALKQSSCSFCHTENSVPQVTKSVEEKGYFILQMEGCPNPIR